MTLSRRTRGGLRAALRDRRGAVAVVAAVVLPCLLGMVALAVDGGLVQVQGGRLQAAADLAALAASASPGGAGGLVAGSLALNGVGDAASSVTAGMYCADPALAVSARFTPGAQSCPTLPRAGLSANAVQVQLTRSVPLAIGWFSPTGSGQVMARAVAVRTDVAGLQVGTTTAQLDGGAVNALLGGLLGVTVGGSALGYSAMLGAQVDVVTLMDALASQAGQAGGTYGALAGSRVTMVQLAAALVTALGGSGAAGSAAAAAAALVPLGPQLGAASLRVGALLDTGPWSNDQVGAAPPSALHASLNAFLVLSSAAQAAGSGGTFSVPALPAVLPAGIASASVTVAALSAPMTPFFGFGPVGESVSTSQVRLGVSLVLSAPLLNLYRVTLPLFLQVASGTAQVSAISCGPAPETDATTTVLAQSGLADAYVGQVTPADASVFAQATPVRPATLVTASGVLTVTGSAHVSAGGSGATSLLFTQADVAAHTVRSVSSTGLPSSLGRSLGSGLSLNASVAGLGLTPTGVQAAVGALLAPVLSSALDPLLASLLSALGLRFGSMDVVVPGMRCGVPALVR